MGRQSGEQQRAFAQRFADQPEIQLFEIAQPAVNQLAGPARGAGGEITRLKQRDRQSTAGRIQSGACADDTAADDDHVEGLRRHPFEGRRAARRPQLGWLTSGCCHDFTVKVNRAGIGRKRQPQRPSSQFCA